MASSEELDRVRGRLLGLIPEERIQAVRLERPSPAIIAAFLSLGDMCSTISDALDRIGAVGVVAGATLVPRTPGTRICGPAITIRYVPERTSAERLISLGERAKLADRDLYGVGEPGDVAVFDCGGFTAASVMGGLSARWARRLGIAGCVIDGAVRDVEAISATGVPVWSRSVTPVSGKHRLEAIAINCPITVAGVRVQPGDIVAADATGICVVPASLAADVLSIAHESEHAENALVEAIDSGLPAEEIVRILAPDRW